MNYNKVICMDISIIGTGYVGLVTGACFAELGHNVTCVDVMKEKIDLINNKKSPIYEEGLEEILQKNVGKNLFATLDLKKAVLSTDITFICVGTPPREDGSIDLKNIKESAEQIGSSLKEKKNYHLIVIKSTVVPGTTWQIKKIIEKFSGKKNFGICMNPEFLREGKAIYDFLHPDRIIIGEYDKKSGNILYEIYKDFSCPILRVDLKTAEMIKYASNAFLATKISFINEIGNICKKLGIDVYKVAEGVGLDSRISPKFLKAGCGFGGSCFPKDVKALAAKAKELGYTPILLESILEINKNQPLRMIELLRNKIGKLENKKIGILGLAFKPGTDDIRESPAIEIIKRLIKERSIIYAYDPRAMKNMKKIFFNINYEDNAQKVIDNSEAILIITEWQEFKNLDYKEKIVIEGRKILEKKGMNYEGICW